MGKIIRRVKWTWRDMFVRCFPNSASGVGKVRVLCLHGVCPDERPYINGRFLRESDFRKLLQYLKEHTYILSPSEWKEKNFQNDRLNILLTFDDGYANNLNLALPILEELELPALWFVSGKVDYLHMDLFDIAADACLDMFELADAFACNVANQLKLKRHLIKADAQQVDKATQILIELTKNVRENYEVFWKLLSDEQLRYVKNHPLISIGNHTRNHLCLTEQSLQIIESEVDFVDRRLEQLGISSEYLAVPYGTINKPLFDLLQKQKARCIFINEKVPELDGQVFERLTVNPFISLKNQIYAIYDGYY